MKNKNKTLLLALIPFIILVFAFEILPLLSIVHLSFKSAEGSYTFMQYKQAFTSLFFIQAIKNSIIVSLISSIVGILISVIGSYSITKLNAKFKNMVILLTNITSNFAGVPLAFAFIILLGNNGIIEMIFSKFGLNVLKGFDLFSIAGIIIVYIYFQIPLGILLMYPAYDSLKKEWSEAVSMLGGTKYQYFRYVLLPTLMPNIIGTLTILFANSMGAYATVYALSSGNINMMPIRISSLISGDLFLNPELASALAIILALILIFSNLISEVVSKKRRWLNI